MRKVVPYAFLLLSMAAVACSDSGPTPGPGLRNVASFASSRVSAIDELILQLFPRGLETATGKRWDHIDAELGEWNTTTLSWTGDVENARKHLLDLVKFIELKTSEIDISTLGSETREHAKDRLILAMSTRVFGGEAALPPAAVDLAVEIVPAGEAEIVQTPSMKAAVQLFQGSTAEDRVIAVFESPAPDVAYGKCEGPLDTDRCQYPRFYRFESFPHVKLLQSARFAVCHVTTGDNGVAAGEDNLIRLAHTLPADPANYTAGGIQEDGIEILPLAPGESIVDCDGEAASHATGLTGVGQRAMYAVTKFAERWLLPKAAHAYDQGPEHLGDFFSDFNAVGFKFNYGSFDSQSSQLELVDAATLPSAGGLILTPSAIFQKGAAWSQSEPFLANGFEASFKFRITNIVGGEGTIAGGADGIAFVIRSIGSSNIAGGEGSSIESGGYGGHMGYMGLGTSLAIEFDSWNNGSGTGAVEYGQQYYDADDLHVSLRVTPAEGAPYEVLLASQATLSQVPSINFEDGLEHTAQVSWANGILQVRLDGRLLAHQPLTLPAGLLNSYGRAKVGFTSATGLAVGTHEITSWKFRAPIKPIGPPPGPVIE